jgi:hypothetical protein
MTFTSKGGWFSITLPVDWEAYDDGDEGTSAFFNSKSWTGNLRITPIRLENIADPTEDKAAKVIKERLANNKQAVKIKLGEWDCVHYKQKTREGDRSFVLYYWETGKMDCILICSFAIDEKRDGCRANRAELILVQQMIRSITIN